MRSKKMLAAAAALALLLGLTACGSGEPEETVSVQAVSLIADTGSTGLAERYAGMVVSGQTAEVKKDAAKKVLELKVAVGDMVAEGDVLFSYDTEAMELELEKLRLEIEGLKNSVTAKTKEIEDIERARQWAAAADQLKYTLEIESLQTDIREAEYNCAIKERELANMEASMEDTEVTAPIPGRVMSIKEESGDGYSDGGSDGAYITIMDMTTYRIEGNISEMNLRALTEGLSVVIRSRIDNTRTWAGHVSGIDWEHPVDNSNSGGGNYVYYGQDTMTQATKYPFYIALDSMDGLNLGQHVYIEPDLGQEGVKEGLWLPAYFLCDTDSAPYVWAANGRDKLEKRGVVLGEYDEELDEYQIASGLTLDDYIAFPDASLKPGLPVTRYDEASFGVEGEGEYVDTGYVSGGDAFVGAASDGNAVSDGNAYGDEGVAVAPMPAAEEGAVG